MTSLIKKMPPDLSGGICFCGIASNSGNLGDASVTVLLCHCRDGILGGEYGAGHEPEVGHGRLVAVAQFWENRCRRSVGHHRDFEALLQKLAHVGFRAQVRRHTSQDDLGLAPLP